MICLLIFYQKNQIMHIETGQCLATKKWNVMVEPCDQDDAGQKWIFNTYDEFKRNLLLKLKSHINTINLN